jgi:Ca-activated chloride channel family protein
MPSQLHLSWGWPVVLAVAPAAVVAALALESGAGRSRRGRALRAAIVALLCLSLARPAILYGQTQASAWLVEPAWRQSATAALQGVAAAARPAVYGYGGVDEPQLDEAVDVAWRSVGDGGRMVLVGSGAALGADPEDAVSRAAARGVTVDSFVPGGTGADAAVTGLEAPTAWRAGLPIPVAVGIRSNRAMSGTLTVLVDGQPLEHADLASIEPAAQTTLRFNVPARPSGQVFLEARLAAEGDTQPRNDARGTVVTVGRPVSVLVVGEDEGALVLSDVLATRGVRTGHLTPAELPARLSLLAEWDVLVLVDVSADSLGSDQLSAVETFVTDLGHGLILTAGRQSFLAGSWGPTALARLAPVKLEPPERKARDPVALLLMVDQSASMGTLQGRTSVSKMLLASEAAVLASEVLQAGDQIGVVAYSETAHWVLPLGEVGAQADLAKVEDALHGLASGGGTSLASALELGLPALADVPDVTRHAVLVSDGRDFAPDADRNAATVEAARRAGVTLSTIAVGFDADLALLQRLARVGHGRYYQADDPAELPRLTMEESQILSAESEQTGDFQVLEAAGPPHAVLATVDVATLPALHGYVAVTARPEAEVALTSPVGDPLLATWNYGLGRVAAWTSDVGEDWAWAWPGASGPSALWSALAAYVAPAPETGPPGLTVRRLGQHLVVEADSGVDGGLVVDLADATLTVSGTSGAAEWAMPQNGPGTYAAEIDAPPAAAAARVRLAAGDASQSAVVVLQPEEELALRPERDGPARMAELASLGGGTVLEQLTASGSAPARRELAPVLLLLAGLLWPADVADELGAALPKGLARRLHFEGRGRRKDS